MLLSHCFCQLCCFFLQYSNNTFLHLKLLFLKKKNFFFINVLKIACFYNFLQFIVFSSLFICIGDSIKAVKDLYHFLEDNVIFITDSVTLLHNKLSFIIGNLTFGSVVYICCYKLQLINYLFLQVHVTLNVILFIECLNFVTDNVTFVTYKVTGGRVNGEKYRKSPHCY